MSTTKLSTVASNLDICELGDERVIDFDIAANTDYEIQSCVIVDEDDRVIEAVVRFGRVEERPELGIDKNPLPCVGQHGFRSDQRRSRRGRPQRL
jgi:hypothetical protein